MTVTPQLQDQELFLPGRGVRWAEVLGRRRRRVRHRRGLANWLGFVELTSYVQLEPSSQ